MLQLLLETVVKTAADHDKDIFFLGNKNSIKTKKNYNDNTKYLQDSVSPVHVPADGGDQTV